MFDLQRNFDVTIREEALLVRGLTTVVVSVICFANCVCASQTLSLSLEAPTLGESEAGRVKSTTQQTQPSESSQTTIDVKIGRVGMVQMPNVAIYQSRSTRSPKFTTVKMKTPLAIVKEEGEWYGVLMINGAIGWIPRASVKMTGYELVTKKPAWNAGKDPQLTRSFETSRGEKINRTGVVGEAIIRTAMQYSGVPYIFGGTDPATGMDCSAFVRAVFAQHGIMLPRTSREQALVGTTVPFDQQTLFLVQESIYRSLRNLCRKWLFYPLLCKKGRRRNRQPRLGLLLAQPRSS